MSVEGLFSLVSASSKKVKSDNPNLEKVIPKKDDISTPVERDLPTSLPTPISQPQVTMAPGPSTVTMAPGPSTSSSLPSSKNMDKEDLTLSRKRKRTHKSRLQCDDPNCTPCSVLVNCSACFNCLNRFKLR